MNNNTITVNGKVLDVVYVDEGNKFKMLYKGKVYPETFGIRAFNYCAEGRNEWLNDWLDNIATNPEALLSDDILDALNFHNTEVNELSEHQLNVLSRPVPRHLQPRHFVYLVIQYPDITYMKTKMTF